MIVVDPTVYAFAGSTPEQLMLTHTPSDYAQRLALFGSDLYYFEGTLSDAASTKTG